MKTIIAVRNNLFVLFVMALLAFSAVADEGDSSYVRFGFDPYNASPGEEAVLIGDFRAYMWNQFYIEGYKTNQKNSHAFIGVDFAPSSSFDVEIRAGMEDEYLKGGVYISLDMGHPMRPVLSVTLGGECLEREVSLVKEKDNDPNDTYEEDYDCGPAGGLELNTYGRLSFGDTNVYTKGYLRGDVGVGSWGASAGLNFQVTENLFLTMSFIYEEPDRGTTDERKEGEAFDAPRVESDTLNLKGEKRAGFGFGYLF